MRQVLIDLIQNTIVLEYQLPCHTRIIKKSLISTHNDGCYSSNNFNNFVKIIYNSILDYSFEEFEMSGKDLNDLQYKALRTRIRYNHESSDAAKISYGFYGEVLLYAVIYKIFNIPTLISRGHFYSVAAKSETAGYDGYHLIEHNEQLELWFGEVKFYVDCKAAINKALKNIDNVVADDYLINNNLIAIFDKVSINNSFNVNSKLHKIIQKWEDNPRLNLLKELVDNKIKLVYPILIIYEKSLKGYDEDIKKAIKHIEDKFSSLKFNGITIDYSLFFVFLPIEEVKKTKEEVIKWIKLEEPLI